MSRAKDGWVPTADGSASATRDNDMPDEAFARALAEIKPAGIWLGRREIDALADILRDWCIMARERGLRPPRVSDHGLLAYALTDAHGFTPHAAASLLARLEIEP